MTQPPSPPTWGQPNPDEPQPDQSQPDQSQPGQSQPGQPYSTPPYGQSEPGQPYPTPSYGEPNPGQSPPGPPAYGQPAYGQPTSTPPGAGQPWSGQPAQFAGGAPPVTKKSNVLKIVLIVVAVIVVLCIGAVVAAVALVRNSDGISNAIATPTTTTSAPPAAKISLVEPATLGDRRKLTDPKFAGAVTSLKEAMAKAPGATSTVGALYGNPAKQDLVMIAGASAPLTNPARELDSTLDGVRSSGMVLTDVTDVDPGPLGGEAKCGNSTTAGIKLAVCAWADRGSVGMIATYFKSVTDVRADFIDLRGEIEKTS